MGEYDAVVIGAGTGGLTCASLLARRGLSLLVLDRNTSIGGTARSFSRGGFSFPCGPLGFSSPQIFPLATSTPFRRTEFTRVHYRVKAFGLSTLISMPLEELSGRLAGRFPDESHGIEEFFADAAAAARELSSAALRHKPELGGLERLSAQSYVEARIVDPALRRLVGSMGTRRPASGFPVLANDWDLMSKRGIWYPDRGLSALARGTADAAGTGRVELRMPTEVSKILIEGGRAAGVSLADGSVVESGTVVCNADYKTTFLKLVGAGDQPPEWRRAVDSAPLSPSALQVSLGIDEAGVDLTAFGGATRLIYRRGETPGGAGGPDWDAKELDPDSLAGEELEVSLWSGDDPGLAPPGKAVVVIRVPAEHRHFERFRPSAGKRARGYVAYKERLARALVSECSSVLPGLERSIEVMDVATPLTFEERAGRWAGTVAGWSRHFDEEFDYSVRPLVLTPLEGLYMAGLQAFSWLYYGGVPTALLTGAMAAAAAYNRQPPLRESIPIPGHIR